MRTMVQTQPFEGQGNVYIKCNTTPTIYTVDCIDDLFSLGIYGAKQTYFERYDSLYNCHFKPGYTLLDDHLAPVSEHDFVVASKRYHQRRLTTMIQRRRGRKRYTYSSSYRCFKTKNERTHRERIHDELVEYGLQRFSDGGRRRSLPTSWDLDDVRVECYRNWKKYRKTQWK